MANKSLFASLTSRLPRANAVNEAGGRAYKLEPKHALAQVAATGTFGNAFYSTAETQLDEVLKLIDEVDDNEYLAKLALYAREKAFMKDMPAALLVALSVRDSELMHRVFDRVVDKRSRSAHCVPDDSIWPVQEQGWYGTRWFVELCAASVPTMVEHSLGRKASECVDR